MKIVCATNMPFVREAFSTLGESRVVEGRDIAADDVRDAEILAIRSTTKVGRALLEGSRVGFVGTATIGTDHLDLDYLDKAGIRWCFAPGCNANSVSEYIVAALLCLGQRHGIPLEGKTIGVMGVGNVGSRVARKARALGMRVVMNDPPRARAERVACQEGDGKGQGGDTSGLESGPFVELEQVLAEADILTLHVPLTQDGPDRTRHLADRSFFKKARKGCIFLNAARGGIVETEALLEALGAGRVSHAVLDTWEGEPLYRTDMLHRVDIGTPHIAGHSFEGKVMGTVMVYRDACRFLGVKPTWSHESLMPSPIVPEIHLNAAGRGEEAIVWDVVRQVYDIDADDRRFRETAVPDEKQRAKQFDRLRREYPERREFPYTTIISPDASTALRRKLSALGFALG